MDFLIKEGSTLPLLKMKVVDSYELDSETFSSNMKNATVTFSMIDVCSGRYIIANKAGGIYINSDHQTLTCDGNDEIIIYYKWTERDTNKAGVYIGEFIINFFDQDGLDNGSLKVPIHDVLHIHIQESFGKTSINSF